MAFLYNEGCENSDGNSTKCIMNICQISQNKFETSYCRIHPLIVYIQKHLNSDLNDPSRNVFTYEYYPPTIKSRITVLSNNDQDGILLLYEYNPYHNKYPEKTYLCRLRHIKQKITLCESVNVGYLGRTLTFDSFDIINEENTNKNIISLKNPNHKIIKSKYDKLLFKELPNQFIKTKYISHYNRRSTLCKKIDNDYMECSDANYSGRLILLDDNGYYDLNRKYLYLPNNCFEENLNSSCSPYICDNQVTKEFVPCVYEEICVVKNIRTIKNISPIKKVMPIKSIIPIENTTPIKNLMPNSENIAAISVKSQDISHENGFNRNALFAMSFMSFLVLFTFFFCLIYTIFRKKRRKIN
ncbi:fam-e protein [Plasmodium gallinaceum]|uniref:Fam-e protein n=1 Tax=Plasmodium gallinaceum TaxID=5849 RepID=A0A1J1GSQ3_PLAGA|nr:fam-e protein [Plasmodium gallinaceum]CRG94075.1 fam-e protein [Plasmodium gallinaceum]